MVSDTARLLVYHHRHIPRQVKQKQKDKEREGEGNDVTKTGRERESLYGL